MPPADKVHKPLAIANAAYWWIIFPLAQLCAVVFWGDIQQQPLLHIAFLAITTLSAGQLFRVAAPFSLQKIFWLFHLVFFGLMPAMHRLTGHFPWSDTDVSAQIMLHAALLVLACLVLFSIAVMISERRGRLKGPDAHGLQINTRRFAIAAPLICLLCCGMLAFLAGPRNLFILGSYQMGMERHHQLVALMADKLLRGAMLYLSVAGILLWRQRRLSTGTLLLILLPVLIACFPAGMPRYLALAFYAAWLLAAVPVRLWRRQGFILLLLAALVFAPMLNVAKYKTAAARSYQRGHLKDLYAMSLLNDFDAYASLCRTMKYVAANGHTEGRQALGAALFFVPRSAWPAKPAGSGKLVYSGLGLYFANVSCPLSAEGYINLGMWGAMLLYMLLAWLLQRYDAYYRRGNRLTFSRIFYLPAIGLLFFLLRGDAMSAVAYITGLAVAGWLMHRTMLRRI